LRGWHNADTFSEYCEELGLPYETLEEIFAAREQIRSAYAAELDFLRSLPTIIDTPYYTFVHGGIPTKDLDALDRSDAHQYMKNDNFISQGVSFDKWTIVGHWPTTLYCDYAENLNPYMDRNQMIIDIDGGCGVKTVGQLNLLIMPCAGDDIFTWRYRDDFPMYRALDPQKKSTDSKNFNFADPWLEILQRNGNFVLVRRLSDGYEMWMPQDHVKEEDGKVQIWGDFSDFRPEIQPGDTVALVRRDAVGTYIKKDGVCGYYDGRLEPISVGS